MINRRQMLGLGSGVIAQSALVPSVLAEGATPNKSSLLDLPLIQRPIPSTGELLPAIGLGTSRTFDMDANQDAIAALTQVMQALASGQGTVVDSSPMYGQAEARVGDVLSGMSPRPPVFAATKVLAEGKKAGIAQMKESARLMNVERLDLIAVHNLMDWRTQLDTLKHWKEEGKVRYIGVTTSHGRRHDQLLEIMRTQPLDFVQFSYNIEDRFTEQQIFPLAKDKGIATMINRPFQRGDLFRKVGNRPLPEWAKEFDCYSWGQYFLKFILSNPAVTCVIPGTRNVQHMRDNMGANFGRLPELGHRVMMLRDLTRWS